MDYTQCYCYECKYCTNDVFGRAICLTKDTVTGDYNRACPDFDFNIVFDPQPEYAKVVNYPYSKLIGYNGIRSIDIIKKIIAT